MRNIKLKISEQFLSLQGESSFAGELCYFIRLTGCNLNCSYCDTHFAKSADAKFAECSIDDLLTATLQSKANVVEITGGEPLLQENVLILCEKLLASGLTVLMETNGSKDISEIPKGVVIIMDCKCPSSGESKNMLLENLNNISKNVEVKFVIKDRADYDYAVAKIAEFDLLNKAKCLLFSPVVEDQTFTNASLLADWIIEDKLNVKLQLQLHKILWDPNERGR